MTTEDKLNEILTIKNEIKQSLLNKGYSIDGKNFSTYPDYIYNSNDSVYYSNYIEGAVPYIDEIAMSELTAIKPFCFKDLDNFYSNFSVKYPTKDTNIYEFPLVTSIGESAFYLSGLSGTVLFPKCTSLGYSAFFINGYVKYLGFPKLVTFNSDPTFKAGMFGGCSNLLGVYIPSTCTTIEASVFKTAFSNFYDVNSKCVIYTDASSKLDGWGTYWNYYSSDSALSVEYNVSYDEFLELIS